MASSESSRQFSFSLFCLLAALLNTCNATTLPDITDDRTNFTIYDVSGRPCLQASFELNFNIYYNSSGDSNGKLQTANVELPSPGNISNYHGMCDLDSGNYSLNISWFSHTFFTTELHFNNFSDDNVTSQWSLYQIRFIFNSSNQDYFGSLQGCLGDSDSDRLVYFTEKAQWFNRTFQSDDYFYCHSGKKIQFSSESGACQDNNSCSYVTLSKAVIFLGDFQSISPSKKLCFEDWVAEREILVPIAVGGFLALLLVIVIMAYVIAFIRRYVRDRHTYHKMRN